MLTSLSLDTTRFDRPCTLPTGLFSPSEFSETKVSSRIVQHGVASGMEPVARVFAVF